MASQADKLKLFELLFNAKEAAMDEKAAAWRQFNQAADRVRQGTAYSRSQLMEYLHQSGYREYARRRHLTERATL